MNQIGFGTWLGYSTLSTFYNLLSIIFILIISKRNYFKNYSTKQVTWYVILYIFFMSLINQHFFIESGKISEDCKKASSSNLWTISMPYIIYFFIISIPYILKKITGKEYKINDNSESKMYLIMLGLFSAWSIYNVYTLSDNQMQTSKPSMPYLSIYITTLLYTLGFYFLMNNTIMNEILNQSINSKWYSIFNKEIIINIMILTFLYFSFFAYSYSINVGGINYDCN